MYWLCAVLFFVLSPGVLVTLPPGPSGKVYMSRETSLQAAAVHAVVFVVVSHFVIEYAKSCNMIF